MLRLVIYLLSLAAAATGLAWLADRPGTLHVEWQGYVIDRTVFEASIALAAIITAAIFVISIARAIWNSPAALGENILKRRQKRGLEALSSGMIAVGAGDQALATRYALQARKTLPHEPLTHLLRAQAAQLSGDRATARRIFESMLAAPDTEQLGLRGLFLEAQREGAGEAATQFASRALKSNPKLGWSADALFDLQCKQKDWAGALDTLALAKKNGHLEKTSADRRRAVLLAGQAQDLEEAETEKALALALEAHTLAPDLVPAAAVAGRILAARGNTSKAAKVLQKTWAKAPHPDLATAYAYARVGDSPRDRLTRIHQLADSNPHSIESPIAVATTAIDARMFNDARQALEPLLTTRLTQRVATLMARVEAGEHGDKGRVREWLARAVHAARDPAWTADGVVSDRWEPVSPVTGALDAFQWRVPVETLEKTGPDLVAERLEELLAISAPGVERAAAAETHVATHVTEPARHRAEAVDAEPVTVRAQPVRPAASRTEKPLPETRAQKPVSFGDDVPGEIHAEAADVEIVKTAKTPTAEPATSRLEPQVASKTHKPLPHAAKPDAKVLVTPPAPDDPGPEDADTSDVTPLPLKRTFRAVN